VTSRIVTITDLHSDLTGTDHEHPVEHEFNGAENKMEEHDEKEI